MGNFFGDIDDRYHTRSLGMLNYTSEEIVPKLQGSFFNEPMVLGEFDKDKYCIMYNGLHRYTILRIHYLLEKMNNQISEEELNEKYTIPVNLEKIDYFKTYCNYLLRMLDNNISCVVASLENYNYTGFVEIRYNDRQTKVVDDFELKKIVLQSLQNLNETSLASIMYYYEIIQSFKEFVDNNFEELKIKIINMKEGKDGEYYQNRKN
jgi:hypothetical protein